MIIKSIDAKWKEYFSELLNKAYASKANLEEDIGWEKANEVSS